MLTKDVLDDIKAELNNELYKTFSQKMVKIKAQNRFGKNIEIFGEGLKARALCHEIDQTNGIFFKSKAISANTFRK